MSKKVTVNLLIYNHRKYLEKCLEGIFSQTYKNIQLIVMDNGSDDSSQEFIIKNHPDIHLIDNKSNLGYAKAHNIGIREGDGEYFMPLNPDVFMTPEFIEEKVKTIENEENIGACDGKLYKIRFLENRFIASDIIDSVGLVILKNRKNYEIGAGERDVGQYEQERYIFGAFGAAPLYKKEMLEDIKIGNEYFDEDFFSYREEVDLAWRAQLRGWKCIYNPSSIAYHVHSYSARNRKIQPRYYKSLQFRNRYLMIMKNDIFKSCLKHSFNLLWYELRAFIYVCFCEPYLLMAYYDAIRLIPSMRKKRMYILKRKSISDDYILSWFK